MDLNFKISVHAYAAEQLFDCVLVPDSDYYGVRGKEMIEPLRRVNGKDIIINNVSNDYTVEELWNWIDDMLYGEGIGNGIDKHKIVEKYFIFNDLRYSIDYPDRPVIYYLHRMGVSEKDEFFIQLLICYDEGDVLREDGIRYYMNSHEGVEHNIPHIHVDVRHEVSGSFSLIDGERLTDEYEGKFKGKDLARIRERIFDNRREWLEFWNEHTDGLTVDLNQVLGTIGY